MYVNSLDHLAPEYLSSPFNFELGQQLEGKRAAGLFTRNLAHLPHSEECFLISKEARKCERVIQANCGFLIAPSGPEDCSALPLKMRLERESERVEVFFERSKIN